MNLKLAITVSIFLFISCNTHNPNEHKGNDTLKVVTATLVDNSRLNDFRKFIGKFKILSLPINLKPLEINEKKEFPILFGSDTAFINTEYKDTSKDKIFAYGLLPDTLNTFKVIWLTPAEIHVPVLTTFSKNGQKISEDYLGVGQCGSDCCYTCNETIKIYTDLTIYSADSIKSCECDSIGPKENTMRKYVLFKTSKIAQDGKFSFSKVTEKKE